MKKKLPKEVFVSWMEYERDVPSLGVGASTDEFAEHGESKVVGRYQLVETVKVEAPTVVTSLSKSSRRRG